MNKVISATKARAIFSEIINRVQYLGEEFVVEKQGKPVAVITKSQKAKQKDRILQKDGTAFLQKLAKYQLRGGPKDLAKEHDKYIWE